MIALSTYELFFIVSALVLLVHAMLSKKRVVKDRILAGALLLGIFIIYLQGANVLLLLPGIAIFYFVGRFYGKWQDVPVALLAIAYVLISSNYVGMALVAQTALIGLLAGTELGKHTHKNRDNVTRETGRDIVQIGLGVIILLVFVTLALQEAETLAVIFLILGYLTADYVMLHKRSALSKSIAKMERNQTLLGEGAIMLGIGTLVAISILNSVGLLIVVLGALYIGDSAATIVGINFGGEKLFYNSNKSVLGTFACFAIVSLISYPFVGLLSLIFGLVAAVAESLQTPLDDNLFVAIILVFALLL